MKIEFRRTGGFAGLSVRLELDSAVLPRGERETLEALIAHARFFDLPQRRGGAHPDAFQYDLAIEIEGRRHVVCLGDRDAPDEIRPLLERLVEMARSRR